VVCRGIKRHIYGVFRTLEAERMNAHIHIQHSLAASNRTAYGDQTVSLVEDSLVLVGCQAGCVPQVCTTR
jgi:hypothetical protein